MSIKNIHLKLSLIVFALIMSYDLDFAWGWLWLPNPMAANKELLQQKLAWSRRSFSIPIKDWKGRKGNLAAKILRALYKRWDRSEKPYWVYSLQSSKT